MKPFILFIYLLFISIISFAQNSISVRIEQPGTLAELVGLNANNIERITITGSELREPDFLFLKNLLLHQKLREIDMFETETFNIPSYAFDGCTQLKSIRLPYNLLSISRAGFYGCSGLTEIILPYSLTAIAEMAFRECSSLSSIILPPYLISIGGQGFLYCNNLKEIHCTGQIPPYCTYGSFEYLHSQIKVYVPTSSKNKYSYAEGWIYFNNIDEEKETYSHFISVNIIGNGLVVWQGIRSIPLNGEIIQVSKNHYKLPLNLIPLENSFITQVLFNNKDITNEVDNGMIYLYSIDRDSELKVIFGDSNSTANQKIEQKEIEVIGSKNKIEINIISEVVDLIEVYSITGKKIDSFPGKKRNRHTISVPAGIYIVKSNSETFKISVK